MGRAQGEKGGVGGKTGKSSLEQGASVGHLRLTQGPRWLGGTLAAWLGLGDAGAAHGLGCDFGYDFSQMTKMCIVTLIVGVCTFFKLQTLLQVVVLG